VGGLLLGAVEAMTAGYISSAYKDAMPFVLILLILFFRRKGCSARRPRTGCDREPILVRPHRPWLLCLPCCRWRCPTRFITTWQSRIAINACVAIGLNLLIGYTGQISLGHAGSSASAPTRQPS